MLEHITDHADRAVARVPAQHQAKPNFEALVRAIAGRYQAVEDALWGFMDGLLLDTAVGAQLDVLGKLVGAAREGSDDEAFRLRIRVQIRLNRGNGTADDVLEVFRLVVDEGNTLRFVDFPPAAFELQVGDALPITSAQAVALLRRARAGGVNGQIVWTEVDDDATFTLCDEADDPVTSDDTGLGDADDADIGGHLAGAEG